MKNYISIAASLLIMLVSYSVSAQVSNETSDDLYITKTAPAPEPAPQTSPNKGYNNSYSENERNSERSNDYDRGDQDQQNGSPDQSSSEQYQDEDGTTYITNNYYNGSNNDGGWYTSQLNHFYSPYMGFGYYDPFYTGFGFSAPFYSSPGLSLSIGFGFGGYYPYYDPWYSWYNPWHTSLYYPYWYSPMYAWGYPYSPYGYGYGYGYGGDGYGYGGGSGSNSYYGSHGSASNNSSNDDGGRRYKESGNGQTVNGNNHLINDNSRGDVNDKMIHSGGTISKIPPVKEIKNASPNIQPVQGEKKGNIPERSIHNQQQNSKSPRQNFTQDLNWKSSQDKNVGNELMLEERQNPNKTIELKKQGTRKTSNSTSDISVKRSSPLFQKEESSHNEAMKQQPAVQRSES
ncbi:MAG: hypothetical protein ABIQ74_01610, partial [Chitinophagales bacterium]